MPLSTQQISIGGVLYNRLCEVTVGTTRWTDLRVTFNIEKSLDKHPNAAEIVIYNLTPQSRAQCVVRGTPISIRAGYQAAQTNGIIYSGQISESRSERDGMDWKTTIQARDGDTAWLQFSSHSFGSGVPKLKLAQTIAADLGYQLSPDAAARLATAGSTRSAVVLHGNAYAQMDRILTPLGLAWSVQDGALQVLDGGGATAEPAIVLSPSTGLIGTPQPMEQYHAGNTARGQPPAITLQALIQPGFRPGRLIALQAESLQGVYVCRKATYTGDTHGNEWTVNLEARQVH